MSEAGGEEGEGGGTYNNQIHKDDRIVILALSKYLILAGGHIF